jgi:hypothetical protein
MVQNTVFKHHTIVKLVFSEYIYVLGKYLTIGQIHLSAAKFDNQA